MADQSEQNKIASADRKVRGQAAPLRHVANCWITSARRPAEDLEASAGKRHLAEEDAQQGRLAGAIGTDDTNEITWPELEARATLSVKPYDRGGP